MSDKKRAVLSVGVLFCGGLAACSSAQQSAPPPAVAAAQEQPAPQPEQAQNATPAAQTVELASADVEMPRFAPLYFDFDSSDLRPEAMATLKQVAEYLLQSKTVALTVVGHSDDRGTPEYNLALGEQRARHARDYLVKLGVEPSRVRTVSLGEERPAVAGDSEDAWSKNRRDELELTGNGSGSGPLSMTTQQ